MDKRTARRAAEWAHEWLNGKESLAELLGRFSIHEIAVWRRKYEADAIARAVWAENERCIRAICLACREADDSEGPEAEYQADPSPMWWHGTKECKAAALRASSPPEIPAAISWLAHDSHGCAKCSPLPPEVTR